MSNLTAFNFNNFEIRTLEIDGEPYFVGKDVASVLGYSDTSDAIRNHVDEEDRRTWRFTGGATGEYNGTIINESGLYSLILKSKLPQAKEFKRWVTSEVLPSIRKTGGYISNSINESQLSSLLGNLLDKVNKLEKDKTELLSLRAENNEYKRENEQLNKVYEEYPGLKEAIAFLMDNINDDSNSFTLKEYIANKPKLVLDHGQRISVGQLVSGWTKIAANCKLTRLAGCTYYQDKHSKLIDLAIRFTQGI